MGRKNFIFLPFMYFVLGRNFMSRGAVALKEV